MAETNEQKIEETIKEKDETISSNESNEQSKEANTESNMPVRKKDTNEVFFRGVIREIRQQLDDQNRIQNALILTTPETVIEGKSSSGTVTIFWGDNDRARQKLGELSAGDHVTIKAKVRTYFTPIERGIFFYGVSAALEHPDGITGLGVYEPDKNEGYFEGTVQSEFKVNDHFVLLNLQLSERFEGRDMNNYPTCGIGGPLHSAYLHSKDKFAQGKRVGAACTIRQRKDAKTGKELNEWRCFALFYEDEDGSMKQLYVRPSVPRPARTRVRTVARSTAESDLSRISKDQTNEETKTVAEESTPVENIDDTIETIE